MIYRLTLSNGKKLVVSKKESVAALLEEFYVTKVEHLDSAGQVVMVDNYIYEKGEVA